MKNAFFSVLFLTSLSAFAHPPTAKLETALPIATDLQFVQVAARDKFERTEIAELGFTIEAVRSDSVWGFANPRTLEALKTAKKNILGVFSYETARGGHMSAFDFPAKNSSFHTYAETQQALKDLAVKHANRAALHVIGKTVEGRDVTAIQINSNANDRAAGSSSKPGVIFMGNHHAREHLSLEVPLMLAEYLLAHFDDAALKTTLENRDIWIIPQVNPDGAEYDIASGSYRLWRKNRRNNGDGTFGVDLNRNYGYGWGTGGSSKDTSSDVYMGPKPFSEPETQVIEKFVSSHLNAKMLLSFHTFSELILYPWGGTYDPIKNGADRAVFEKMAKTMAAWNGYKPQQASDLYIASGDTTDWAYGTHGIFAFTFELSPKNKFMMSAEKGFYPGQAEINPTFQENLKPLLYMIDLADDPYRATKPVVSSTFGYVGTAPTMVDRLSIHPF